MADTLISSLYGSDRLRLSDAAALQLLESNDLLSLGAAANEVCNKLHSPFVRTYKIERNINYTNICECRCRFCAFYRCAESSESYVLDWTTMAAKIAETVSLGGNQILLQGGLHSGLPFEWYEDLLRQIRSEFPQINIHGFSPCEVVFFSKTYRIPVETVLIRLKTAGLGSLPGGGAEILCDEVRNKLSPRKATADEWIETCRIWHRLGGIGSATMMFGHLETRAQRIEHLRRIRNLQDETGGFTTFIPWTFQRQNTELVDVPKTGVWEYLKLLAVSRLYLDSVPHIQSSWVTQGLEIGALGLHFGADDLGSVMIEENVVAAAGTTYRTNEEELRRVIESVGFRPHCVIHR